MNLRGQDGTEAANTDNVASCHGTDCWASCVVQTPTEETRTTRESSCSREENGHVLDVRVVGSSEDRESNHAQNRESCEIDTTQPRPVTSKGDSDGEDTSDTVWCNTVKLRHGCGVAHVAEQSRQEERERLHCDVDSEEAESAYGVVDVEDGTLDVHQLDLLVDIGAVLAEQTLSGDGLLTLCEELALVRVSLHEERRNKAYNAGEETLEEENVTPGVDSHGSNAKFGNPNKASSQKTTEGSCERTGRDEDTDAEQQLVPLVEAREKECNAGHGAALGQTQECTRNEQAGVSLHEGSAKGDQAEREDQERNPEPRSDSLQDDVRWNLNAVRDVSVTSSHMWLEGTYAMYVK